MLPNVPNTLTLLRILAIPAVLIALDGGRFGLAFWLFVAASITDGLDGAAFHRLAALGGFLVIFRLFEEIRIPFVFGTGEIVRCGFTTQVAVDALAVHIEFASYVFRVLVFAVSHGVGND